MSAGVSPTKIPDHSEDSVQSASVSTRYLSFGEFQLDRQRNELFKDGARVKLQGKVCEVLLALLEKPGEVITREDLRTRLWPADSQVNYDANVNTTVNKLRQVLGDSPERPEFVETIPRKGYSFVAKVEYVSQIKIKDSLTQSASEPNATTDAASFGKSYLFAEAAASKWMSAGIIALIIAGMLLGAAITLYSYRGI